MTFEMTHKEARALAAFLTLIRDRSGGPVWHKAGIEDALARARQIAPSPDLAIAAIRAAREPSNRTPAVIGMEGPHWQGSSTPPRRPYDAVKTCDVCGFSQAECHRRWSGDHEFEAVAHANARVVDTDADAVHRRVVGLREAALDAPPSPALHPAPETPTNPEAASVAEEAAT